MIDLDIVSTPAGMIMMAVVGITLLVAGCLAFNGIAYAFHWW